MSRVDEILEQIMLEDADAGLYSVMLSFLKRKATENDVDVDDIFLSINEDHKELEVTVFYGDNHESSRRVEEIKFN